MASTSGGRPDAAMVGRGAVAGLCAFIASYGITYGWRAPAVADSLRGVNVLATLLGVDAIPTWKGVAWVFYGAHGVATRVPTPGGGTELVNVIEQSGDGTVALLYVLVPVVLVLAGAVTARLSGTRSPAAGATAGATVVVGYVVPAVGGIVIAAHAIGDTGASIAPDPVAGVLLAGLLYPVACGALGGAMASMT